MHTMLNKDREREVWFSSTKGDNMSNEYTNSQVFALAQITSVKKKSLTSAKWHLIIIIAGLVGFWSSAFAVPCYGLKKNDGANGSLSIEANGVLILSYTESSPEMKQRVCFGRQEAQVAGSNAYKVEKNSSLNCEAARSFVVKSVSHGKAFVDIIWPRAGAESESNRVESFICVGTGLSDLYI